MTIPIKDTTGMKAADLVKGKKVINGIMNEHFSSKEIADFEKNNISMQIKKLPPDIAGQSVGNKIFFDPDTVQRADGVTEDVVVHELVHAYNRFREERKPNIYVRKESQLDTPKDIQNDMEIEEAVTEAITASKLGKYDSRSKEPIALNRGDLHKRYNRHRTNSLTDDMGGHTLEDEAHDLLEWLKTASQEEINGYDGYMEDLAEYRPRWNKLLPTDETMTQKEAEQFLAQIIMNVNDNEDERYSYWEYMRKMQLGKSESSNSFEFNGMDITDPFMDETGRYPVNPRSYYGEPYFDWLEYSDEVWVGQQMETDDVLDKALIKARKLKPEKLTFDNLDELRYQEILRQMSRDTYDMFFAADGYTNASIAQSRQNREIPTLEELESVWADDPTNPEINTDSDLFDSMKTTSPAIEKTRKGLVASARIVEGNKLYRLNAIPVDPTNIIGPMNEDGSDYGEGLDERAGQVYDLSKAYALVNESSPTPTTFEEEILEVYATQQDAENAAKDILVYDGELLVKEIDEETVMDLYRNWPFYFRKGEGQFLKTGLVGENVVYKNIGFSKANAPLKTQFNWLTKNVEDFENGPEFKPSFNEHIQSTQSKDRQMRNQAWRNQLYYRRLSGKTYRGIGNNLSKNNAKIAASKFRRAGFNARVIPNSKGHRLYLRRKNV